VSRGNDAGGGARTLSDIGTLVTITEFDRFMYTGGRARGYSSPEATYMRCYMPGSQVDDRYMPLAVCRSTSTVGLPRESKIYCQCRVSDARRQQGKRGETFLAGVNFSDGHDGGVNEAKRVEANRTGGVFTLTETGR